MNVISGKRDVLLTATGMEYEMNSNFRIKESVKKLNCGRLGSFGEFLFEKRCNENSTPILRYFKERTDFMINGSERIDVKSSCKFINNDFSEFKKYSGTRLKGIAYVYINFHNDVVSISNDSKPFFNASSESSIEKQLKLQYTLLNIFQNLLLKDCR